MSNKSKKDILATWLLIIVILIMLAVTIYAVFDSMSVAKADGYLPEDDPELHLMYALCQPNDYICIRSKSSRKSSEEGYLLCGYSVYVSDKTKNGYIYSPSLDIEAGKGWIFSGYLVNDEPQEMDNAVYKVHSKGRVAARKYIGGKVRSWLKNGDLVEVRYMTEEWCVTNKGFVMTKYLEEA